MAKFTLLLLPLYFLLNVVRGFLTFDQLVSQSPCDLNTYLEVLQEAA